MCRVVGACLGVGLAVAFGCAGKLAPSDAGAGVDAGAGGACATNADCPSGTGCGYAIGDGCSASRRCIAKPSPGACKGQNACACDGTSVSVCGPSSKPIRSVGFCDAGTTGCSSGLGCEQCDVTGYAPATMGTPATVSGACTQQQLQAFVAACFSASATATTCQAWEVQDTGACSTCLTPVLESAASWGPFACASASSPCEINSGGCVDLVLGTTADEHAAGGSGSCGDLVTTSSGCQDYACGSCGTTDFQTCDQSAVANECASFVAQAASTTGPCAAVNGDAASPAASKCFPQTDVDNVAFVNVFCGTGP